MSDVATTLTNPGTAARLWQRAREPVDGASLGLFRIALGLLIAYDAVRKGNRFFGAGATGAFRFPYEGFEWVPAGGAAAPWIAKIWLVSALCVMLGLFYRPAMILTAGLTIFGFLQAEEFYLNHYYLLIIVCLLMCCVPANRAFALDPYIFKTRSQPQTVARMHLWLLKGQTEIVLIYAGVVKLNPDWLQLEPLRSWLIERKDSVFFGGLLQYDWAISAGNYGIIALHILGAPLLLWKRTRLPIFLVYCIFHMSNHFLFNIGIFPWMVIAMSALFFAPDWPRRLLHIPALERFQAKWTPVRAPWTPRAPDWRAGAFAACACIWLFSQTVIPLRHYLFKGDVAWTYEGHRFSWRMKLVDRWSPDPIAIIFVPQENLILSPPMRKILSPRQHNNVATHPRSARKFAQQIAGIISKTKGWSDIRVHLYFPVGYNNREAILLIDPRVNLVTAPTHLRPPPWIITHNDKPLRRIEQFSSQHAYPDIIQLAQMMNLPRPVDCITGADGWMVCTLERAQNLTQVR